MLEQWREPKMARPHNLTLNLGKRFKHGMCGTRTRQSWVSMKRRCYNKNAHNYKWYGGRGIKVCDRWKDSFLNFLEDMGERPPGMTLDRKDPGGDYEPGNCRWADSHTQRVNRRT